MRRFSYVVRPNDPCIFVELYLPKKAELQEILYETLTQGFQRQVVVDHFIKADKAKKRAILDMLGKGWTTFPTVYPNNDEIILFPRLFFGYSTYEVDGVFLTEREDRPKSDDDDKWYSIVEERTQVLRLIFKYEVFDRPLPEIDFTKAAMRDPFSEIGPFKENYPYVRERIEYYRKTMNIDIDRALTKLDVWINYVGLFLFGYLLFNICDKIAMLSTSDSVQRTSPAIKQDEIWVSSFWNMNVNVVKWLKL